MRFSLFILIVLVACSKSNDPDPNVPVPDPKEDLEKVIVNKKYVVTSLTGKRADGTLIPESRDTIPEYEKDDYFLFKSDHTWTGNNNILKEPGNSDEIWDYGTWTLTNNVSIQLYGTLPFYNGNPANYLPLKIISTTDTTLKWESIAIGDTLWGTFTVIP